MGNQQGRERRDHVRKIDWIHTEIPSPPGKPFLVSEPTEKFTDITTIRWSPPFTDGGAPIIGYLVEHRRTGSPHWLRATPHLVLQTELSLTGLEPGWRYQFRVSAKNEVGISEPGELSEQLMVTPQKWAASPPFFNVELEDKIGLENEKVEFKVHVLGVPVPTISWYKNGYEVFSSRRTKIVTEDDRSTFIIHQAALEDEGEIKCTATNRAGHAVTKAILKLEAPPRIRLPRQYDDGLIFEKGELIRLKATAAGRPKPRVVWYHNGEVLEKSDRIDISDSEGGCLVKIEDACRSDRGEYAVKGTNKIGEDVASFLVTVADRPMPPTGIQVTSVGRLVTLTWSSPEDDGGCKIGSYIIEYFRAGWDIWLKAKNSRQLMATLENLIEGSEYKFRIRAENPYGVSEPSEESETIFIPDTKRGILTPSPRSDLRAILKENKRQLETETKENESGDGTRKRLLLEEKARKLLDTPLSQLMESRAASKPEMRKSESSAESMLLSEGDENVPPSVPRRKNKGKNRLVIKAEDSAGDRELITRSMDESLGKTRAEPRIGEAQSAQALGQAAQKAGRNLRLFLGKDTYNPESPEHPREKDDSIIHGSSELMLVIYPKEISTSVELTGQQRREIEMSLREEGTAPPMSLSSPELNGTVAFELPPMREAVSSTEILYERTAARLYQDAIAEEEQKVLKRRFSMERKSSEKRSSLKEFISNKRHSFRENEKPEVTPVEKVKIDQERTAKAEVENASDFQSKSLRNRMSSVEKERIEFALVRERLQRKEEEKRKQIGQQKPTGMIPNHHDFSDTTTATTTTTTSSSAEPLESYEEEGDEEENESENSLFRENAGHSGSKEDEESDFDMSDILKLKDLKTTGIAFPKPRKISPFAEVEDDTYHPRSMVPTRSILTKVERPEETPKNKLPAEKPLATAPVNEKKEKSAKPSKTPASEKKTKKTSKILKKLGLKRGKTVPEVLLTPPDPNLPPPPKPILKNVNQSKPNQRGLGFSNSSEKTVSEEESENEISGRKKKVRIAEPSGSEAGAEKEEAKTDDSSSENQVLICHYSNIVKEFGSNHRRPPTSAYLKYSSREPIKAIKPAEPEPGAEAETHHDDRKSDEKVEEKLQLRQPDRVQRSSFNLPTLVEYLIDIAMFVLACWLYLFKNELYAVPVLCIMAYRQLKDYVGKMRNPILDKFFKPQQQQQQQNSPVTNNQ